MLKRLKSKMDNDSNLKELVSGSVITFGLKISGMMLGYFVFYLISKKNGADGAGYYSLINQLLMLLGTVAALGTNVSVLRYVGQFNNHENASQMRPLYGNILKLIIPFSIVVGGSIYFFAELIADSIFHNLDYVAAIQLAGLILPLSTVNLVGVEFVRGLKKLKISEFIRSVSRPLLIISCILIYWNQNLPNIYIIYFVVIAVIVNSILSSGTVLFHLQKIKKPESNQLSNKELFKVSSPMMMTSIATALMSAVSVLLIEYYNETDKVGVYSAAFSLAQLIAIVLIVVNTIAAPKFSELYWAKKKKELQKVLHQSSKLMFWSSLIISALVIIGSKWLLGIFGSEFEEGQIALIVLVCGQLINSATGSVGLFLNMSGNQKILRNTALIALVIQCVFAMIAIPYMGILGAAIATSTASVLWNLMCILYVSRKLNLKTYYLPFLNNGTD